MLKLKLKQSFQPERQRSLAGPDPENLNRRLSGLLFEGERPECYNKNMKYRRFGKTEEKVSVLGFGCMRLPVAGGDESKIVEDESIKMIRYAVDNGVNYIDTAWPYHGGASEPLTGRALKDGYREKVKLATKLPLWLVNSREDMDNFLNKQLERLETDYIDFYLMHAVDTDSWEKMLGLGMTDFIEKALASGRIRHAGFSFHDDLPVFKRVVDGFDWDFCQIQYNFMDVDYQAGLEGLEYAAARDLGVVIMEPLRGGSFLKNIPPDIEAEWRKAGENARAADMALRFIWDHPAVSTVLSGMSTMQQVEENVDSACAAEAGGLTALERDVIESVRQMYDERIIAACTNCKYCMPCPSGVDIPANLAMLNNTSVYNSVEQFRVSYTKYFDDDKKASKCVECGQCEDACPQHIPVIEKLKQLEQLMA